MSSPLLLAGMGDDGPALYHMDPSGTYVQFQAKAIGSAHEGAQSALQDEYNKSLTLEEAETLAMKVLKQVMEEKISPTNIELAITKAADAKLHMFAPDELQTEIDALPAPTVPTLAQAAGGAAARA